MLFCKRPLVDDAPGKRAKLPALRYWYRAMQQDLRKLTIQNYKEQVAANKLLCAALAGELRDGTLPFEQREAIAHRWEKALREGYAFQFMLDRLEQEEHEDTVDGESNDSTTHP
jgi:hypothetical protein